MEEGKVCPFMSTGDRKVNCIKGECQIWFSEDPEKDSSLSQANCSLAYLPQVIVEIAAHTRLIRSSMEDSVAI